MSLLHAHRDFLSQALERLCSDPRVAAVLVSGSVGRGEEDEWSDLDLIVACFEESATVVATPMEAERFDDLALWVDCSFNAPPRVPPKHSVDTSRLRAWCWWTGTPGPCKRLG
jgi:predicted nucleotidyltransferase